MIWPDIELNEPTNCRSEFDVQYRIFGFRDVQVPRNKSQSQRTGLQKVIWWGKNLLDRQGSVSPIGHLMAWLESSTSWYILNGSKGFKCPHAINLTMPVDPYLGCKTTTNGWLWRLRLTEIVYYCCYFHMSHWNYHDWLVLEGLSCTTFNAVGIMITIIGIPTLW